MSPDPFVIVYYTKTSLQSQAIKFGINGWGFDLHVVLVVGSWQAVQRCCHSNKSRRHTAPHTLRTTAQRSQGGLNVNRTGRIRVEPCYLLMKGGAWITIC